MENFIYLLIGIAWVAYSLYTARQKAIQKQQSPGLPPSGPSKSSPLPIPGNQGGGRNLLNDVLREITGETRTITPQTVQPAIPAKQVKPKNVSELNQTYDDHSGYKFITSPSVESSRIEPVDKVKDQYLREHLSKGHHPLHNFDLREAVIYSELLNRKYF